jgi:hypothetical protein
MIGCISMLYKALRTRGENFQISHPNDRSTIRRSQVYEASGRPFFPFLESFGPLVPKKPLPPDHTINVSVSFLTISALSLNPSEQINIVWVRTLGLHLCFDAEQRTLSLFRFPSFCALFCLPRGSRTLFDW